MKRRAIGLLLAAMMFVTTGCGLETGESQSNGGIVSGQTNDVKTEEQAESELVTELADTTEELGRLVYLGDYDSYGWGFGNAIPVKTGDLWGLIDFEGNTILKPTYAEYWGAPNNEGYTIFADDNGYYIVGLDGTVHTYDSNVADIRIDEENIVSYIRYTDEFTGDFVYEKLDGTLVYKVENAMLADSASGLVPFNDGKAYVYLNADWSSGQLIEIAPDGSSKLIDKDSDNHITITPYGSCSDGYLVGTMPGWGGGTHLYNTTTKEKTGRMIAVKASLLEGVDWESWYLENAWFAMEFDESVVEEIYYDNFYFNSCFHNGTNLFNVKNYGCITVTLPDESTKDILFDYLKVEDELLENYVVMYDTIRFDDFKYLVVRDGETWYYIDFQGNVVSGPYTEATAFNNEGYAVVMDENGEAYIINELFEAIANPGYIVDVGNNGELFLAECEFEESGRPNGIYAF